MTLQLDHPALSIQRRGRIRGERTPRSASRPRRIGMVSEAIVARYIRDLAAPDRRAHGATDRPPLVRR